MADDRDLFRAPVGTHDVLFPESDRWQVLVARFADRARRYGFGLCLTPVYEHVEVFKRVGETTDVVSKEMYEFEDKGGRHLVLRPEGTAPVVRAFVQHRPLTPWKAWYVAPNFRHEKPQKGRYRQHWQVGAEVLGVEDPGVDVEVIDLAACFFGDLDLRRVKLLVNSMGDETSRVRYREVLLAHLRKHADVIGAEMARAEANPLRILDSKREDWRHLLESAPQLGEYLTEESATHFERVQEGLRSVGIDFEIAPRLVRGFDYYTGTTFEFRSDALDAAQNAIGGGGRYDRLSEEMGGPSAPGIGFGIGIERVLLACDAEGALPAVVSRVDVYVVDALGGTAAIALAHDLREAGIATDRAFGHRSVKKQWSAADKSGARHGVMLAPREWERERVVVKDLRTGEQTEVRRSEVVAWLLAERGSEER